MTTPHPRAGQTASVLSAALAHPRLAGLDSLRALAVLAVLLDHLGWHTVGPLVLFNGGLGVEVFFVLSGFLITWLLLQEHDTHGRIAWGAFFRRRVARLMPGLLTYIVLGVVLLLARGKAVPWEAVGAAGLYVINYYQAFTGAPAHYLSHCWSLAVEEQFYLLWPLALTGMLRYRWPLARTLAWGLAGLWLVKVVWLRVLGMDDVYMYRALETRVDQLAVGCLLAVVLRSPQGRAWFDALAARRWVLWVGIVALLGSSQMLHGTLELRYLVGFTLEPLLIAVLLPLWLVKARQPGARAQWLVNAPLLVFWGQISYGLYLFHPFVVHPVYNAVMRSTGSVVLGLALALLAITVVAWGSFRWVEQPLRRWLMGHRPVQTSTPASAGVAAVAPLSTLLMEVMEDVAEAATPTPVLGITPARSGE